MREASTALAAAAEACRPPHLHPRLKQVRVAAGLSQGALAARVGITRRTLNNWEWERTAPTIDDVARLAVALGVPWTALYTWHDTTPEAAPDAETLAAKED